MFPVLLHPELFRRLRKAERGTKTRLWKALLRLRDGQWGGGTRVKRLRGVGRPVYEARTDSGDRLLFTMVRSADAARPDRLIPHLQIWDLVAHDDAERTARRNRAPEAEFLELETVEEMVIEEPPPSPAARFAEIPADIPGDESEPLLRFLLPPDDLDLSTEDEIPGGVRWFLVDPASLATEEDLQRLFDAGEELELKLTREQYQVLRTAGPLLLAGSAGSGKTTIAIHRLAAAALQPAPSPVTALYLSYSQALVDHARVLYRDLVAAKGAEPGRAPDFFTFGDLYRSLVPRDFREHQARPMSEALFREWFRKAGRSLDPALVWEELRSILKGSCLSPTQPMLDEAAYFELGRKRAPLFVDERPEIWRIAQRYQEWLAEEGRSDRIDLCRRAFAELRQRKPRYDVVICDEVQDLTELEVAFVLSLSRRPGLEGVLLTGDMQQIVNPSGFRWAEVRRLTGKAAHLRAAPEVVRLRRNLRSVRPLVELACSVLLLRREVFGRTEEDDTEEAALEGPIPVEVPGDEEEVLAAIRGFGPRCAVLTLEDAEAERLRGLLDTTRVFHVREAKGLEFETIVLWKMLEPDRDLAERFARVSPKEMEKEARFKRLLQHLYVGVTRARRHLAIHEGPTPHPFWADDRFRGRFERGTVESLSRLFQSTASPAAWEQEGGYFLERGRWRQAAECYRRAACPEKEAAALAHAAEEREDWAGALDLWSRLGAIDRQAPLLERLGRLSEALPLYRQAGLDQAARLCELRILERDGRWAVAAEGWEALDHLADAARCWARGGDEQRAARAAARAAEASADWSRAGETWLDLGENESAVRCFRAAGEPARAALAAARLHEAAHEWRRAGAAYRLAGRRPASLRCRALAHEAADRPDRAAPLWEKLSETDRAAEAWARANRWLEVARIEAPRPEGRQRLVPRLREMLEHGDWEQAWPLLQERLRVLQPRLPDVPWFVFDDEQRLVWQESCLLENLMNTCEAQKAEQEGAWTRAARRWTQAGERERAAAAWRRRIETIRDPQRRARALQTLETWGVDGNAPGEPDDADAERAS
jgi:DNA helicase-2/ATP-dependent DNA helicase PcrA